MIFNEITDKVESYINKTFIRARTKGTDGFYFAIAKGRKIELFTETAQEIPSVVITNRSIKNWVFETPQLGYSKDGEFLKRTPSRVWKLGLSHDNTGSGLFHKGNTTGVVDELRFIQDKGYKPFWLVMKEVLAADQTIPFARKYAANRKSIFFCDEKVADILKDEIIFMNEDDLNFHMSTLLSYVGGRYTFTVKKKQGLNFNEDI